MTGVRPRGDPIRLRIVPISCERPAAHAAWPSRPGPFTRIGAGARADRTGGCQHRVLRWLTRPCYPNWMTRAWQTLYGH